MNNFRYLRILFLSLMSYVVNICGQGSPFPTINGGDFSFDVLNTNSGWQKSNQGADSYVKTNSGSADLYQQWGIHSNIDQEKFAKLSYSFSNTSPINTSWKISAKLKWVPTSDANDLGFAEKSIALLDQTGSLLFSITVTGSTVTDQTGWETTIVCKTPTDSKTIGNQKMNINRDSFSNFRITYDPTSGFTQFKMDSATVYCGCTNEGISIKTILFKNYIQISKYSPGNLFVDDVKAEYVPSTPLILHNIPNGTFNKGYTTTVPGGSWSTYANNDGNPATANAQWVVNPDDSTNGYIQLINNWMPRSARITYEDIRSTLATIPWRISVDLKGSYTRHYRDDIFSLADASGNSIFIMDNKGAIGNSYSANHSVVNWQAGNLSGSVTDVAEIGTDYYKTLSFEYNPISGQATGRIANKTIFSIFTTKNLCVKKVSVENCTQDKNTWDPGILFVDNFRSEAIPNISGITVLHGIEKGNFTDLPATGTGTVTYGWWQSYSTQTGNIAWDSLSKVSLQGSGDTRHVELGQNWKDHCAYITYNDFNTTPLQQTWKICADLKGSYLQGSQTPRKDAMQFLDQNAHPIFSISFNSSNVYWDYFDEHDYHNVQSETICNSGLSNSSPLNFTLQYNPLSGEIVIYRNNAQIYSTIVDMNILISKVSFCNKVDANTYDPGTFIIDNVISNIDQNRDIKFRGIATISLSIDVLRAIKKYGANQVRYFIAPKYECKAQYNSQTTDPLFVNTYPFWNAHISTLSSDLENARKLGLAVVINVHQTPSLNWSTQPNIWDNNDENEKFKLCWRQITDCTQHLDQVIWLELYNEPNVNTADNGAKQTAWNSIAQQTIDQIRGQNLPAGFTNYNNAFVDRKHPIIFCSGPGALDWGFRFAPLMRDDYFPIIYTLHQWKDEIYTQYGSDNDKNKIIPNWFPDRKSKNDIRIYLKQSKIFQDFYKTKMWVGEFGVYKYSKERDLWIKDHIDLFEEYGWDWQFWCWDGGFFPEINFEPDSTTVGSILFSAFQLCK